MPRHRNTQKNPEFDPNFRLDKDRAYSLVVYDLQGGPIHTKAVQELENFAEKIAEQYNLAIYSTVE